MPMKWRVAGKHKVSANRTPRELDRFFLPMTNGTMFAGNRGVGK